MGDVAGVQVRIGRHPVHAGQLQVRAEVEGTPPLLAHRFVEVRLPAARMAGRSGLRVLVGLLDHPWGIAAATALCEARHWDRLGEATRTKVLDSLATVTALDDPDSAVFTALAERGTVAQVELLLEHLDEPVWSPATKRRARDAVRAIQARATGEAGGVSRHGRSAVGGDRR